jgi:hypothetical protein
LITIDPSGPANAFSDRVVGGVDRPPADANHHLAAKLIGCRPDTVDCRAQNTRCLFVGHVLRLWRTAT